LLHICEKVLLFNCRQLAVFTSSKDSAILSIIFNATTSHLVAGTEKGCFAWKFDTKFLTGHQSSKRYVEVSCCLQAGNICSLIILYEFEYAKSLLKNI